MVKGLSDVDFEHITSFNNERFKLQGDDVSSVGWKDESSQYLRFERLFDQYLIQNLDQDIKKHKTEQKIILDVGCGLGDLYQFLCENYHGNFHYIGIDISEQLINQAQKKYSATNCHFFKTDLFSLSKFYTGEIDFAVESGMLSYKIENNKNYAKQIMREMFRLANDGIAMNFLSDNVDYQLDKNFHYSSATVMSWTNELTTKSRLDEDYPLWEFTVILEK